MVTCPSCGAKHPDGFRFCPSCGASIAEPGPSGGTEVRKTVTIVFCDVVCSTAMGETLDPEAVRRVMARYFDRMRTVLERHGATVEKFIGDAVMAVFGIPEVREDDALRAVRAAAEMREGLRELNKELERDFGVELESRIGVNTGEVVTGTGAGTLATGDAMNAAARLEQAAAPGEVLVGAVTYALVRDAVEAEPVPPISVRGKAEPVHAYRLAVVTGAHGVARRFDTPMVGRERELRMLREALDRAVSDRACVLFTLLGTAGVGKSRLIEEFLAGRDGVRVLRGRCLPYGDGITYWPVVEMLTQGAGLGGVASPQETRERLLEVMPGERDSALVVDRLGQLLGLAGAEGVPDETHWAVRKLLEAMARQEPLVVDLDDLHFAEPALLDLVEHVSDWTRGAPILLVCSARHDLLDARPDWGGGKLNATTIALEPLSEEETEERQRVLRRVHPVEPERGSAAGGDGLALLVHDLRVALDDPHRPGHAFDPLDLLHERVRDPLAGVAERVRRPDRHRDTLVDLREQLVERVAQRVGQHVGSGNERHTEDHRERREDQAKLVGDEPLDGGAPHG